MNERKDVNNNWYDFSNEVRNILFSDTESHNIYIRWKIVVLYKDGQLKLIYETEENKKLQKHKSGEDDALSRKINEN